MILQKEELRKLQQLEVEMLQEFVRICDTLGLRYYVLAGTLLGAVRHGGFIPWDDDIDVGMPRADYEVFWQKAPDFLPKHMFLQHHRSDEGYCANMVKIRNINTTYIEKSNREQKIRHGVFLDIFPLDNYPQTKAAKFCYKAKSKILAMRIGREFTYENKNPIKELLKTPLDWIWPDVKKAVEAKERLFASVPESEMITTHFEPWGGKEVIPAAWYAEGCELSFEGIKIRVPKEYQKWLTRVYGDYMQLPPEEKRVSHHETIVIDLERPYTEYLEK